jgi:Uroporphyrinogen decarboxylase (URO-D)
MKKLRNINLYSVCSKISKKILVFVRHKGQPGCIFRLENAAKLARIAIGPTDFAMALYDKKLCFCRNIDNAGVLTNSTPDEVRAEVLEHLERLSSGGGYVCGPSHEITDITPFENFRTLVETICSYKCRTVN